MLIQLNQDLMGEYTFFKKGLLAKYFNVFNVLDRFLMYQEKMFMDKSFLVIEKIILEYFTLWTILILCFVLLIHCG